MNVTSISTAAIAVPVELVDDHHQALSVSGISYRSSPCESLGSFPVASSTRLDTLQAEVDSFMRQSEYMTISIFKLSPRSYTGISFTEDETKVIRVGHISDLSPFATTPLRSGDAVVSVNHFEATSANLVDRLFKSLDLWVTLVIHTRDGTSNFVTTILKKRVPDQRLGVEFTTYPNRQVCIANLDARGVLAHTSLLQIGDVVHTVNGQAVNTEEVAMEALSSNPDQVEMVTASPQGVVLVFRGAPFLSSFWCTGLCCFLSLIVIVVLVSYFVVAGRN